MSAGAGIAARFDAASPLTIGLEEELMLLDPETLDLAPRSEAVIDAVGTDPRFKRELPACQIETATTPCATVGEAIGQLSDCRRALATKLDGLVKVAASGTHAFAAPLGELNSGPHYDALALRYGDVARRQQVFALQVHVAPGSADSALAVYNALRGYLPEITALAANSPFHGGGDTGHASYRAKLAELLPRQGVPPALESWDHYAAELEWGTETGALSNPGGWWWELRPHHSLGTLELRVPDAQTRISEAGAVAAFAHALIAWLIERHQDGETLPCAPSWRIAENRWFAVRDGLDAQLADLDGGEVCPARERVNELLGELNGAAAKVGCADELAPVAGLLAENGAQRQRRAEAADGLRGVVAQQSEEFLEPPIGGS
jgi:carboxylate-amine ligase